MNEPTRTERLELDIDLRLLDVYEILCEEFQEFLDEHGEVITAFMRAAYGRGFCDALIEPDPYAFFYEHGYMPPVRRAA